MTQADLCGINIFNIFSSSVVTRGIRMVICHVYCDRCQNCATLILITVVSAALLFADESATKNNMILTRSGVAERSL